MVNTVSGHLKNSLLKKDIALVDVFFKRVYRKDSETVHCIQNSPG